MGLPFDTPVLNEGGFFSHPWATALALWFARVTPGSKSGLLAAIPTTLKKNDKGYKYTATDYARTFTWDGTNWTTDSADPSGRLDFFDTDPGAGWRLLDGVGSPITVSKRTFAAGVVPTRSVVIADQRGKYPKGAAAYTGVAVAAAGPALTGALATEAAHTHAIDHDHPAFTTGAPSATTVVASGAGATVASSAHTHSADPPLFTGPSGAGSAHTHGNGTLAVDATGEPAHVDWLPFIRL